MIKRFLNSSSEQSPGSIRHGEEQGHEDSEEHLHLQPRLLRPPPRPLSPLHHQRQAQ